MFSLQERHWASRLGIKAPLVRDIVTGDIVRDWAEHPELIALAPYDLNQRPLAFDGTASWGKYLWAYRAVTENVIGFGGRTRKEDNAPWWTWYRWVAAKYRTAADHYLGRSRDA